MPRRTDKPRQGDEAAVWMEAYYRLRDEADARLRASTPDAEGRSIEDLVTHYPDRWEAIFNQLKQERPLPPHPVRVREERQTWVRGTQLAPDEQRYVLGLFPESRAVLNLSEREWLEQTAFRLKKDGALDLRHRYCRTNPGANRDQGPYRYHRSPRYQPLPDPPKRQQKEREQQKLPPGVRQIVEEALATGDLVKANERLHHLSGGKTIQQVADEWAQQMQTPAEPEQREQQQSGERG